MKRVQQGFTLIELMIVVAIIGILAAVAIPQYQNYVVKSRLASAMSAIDSFKTAVAVCIQEHGGSPTTCSDGSPDIPTDQPTNEVQTVSVASGVITATLRTGLGFGTADTTAVTLTFNPIFAEGDAAVRWSITPNANAKAVVSDAVAKNSTSGS